MEPKVNAGIQESSREVHVLSVCGPVRDENQDAGVAWRGEGDEVAVIVADGMGGHAAGREAAEITVRCCVEAIRGRADAGWERRLGEAIAASHAAVQESASSRSGRTMGATVALAVVDGPPAAPVLHVAHVGDSRVYLYRGRSLFRLTADHSLVAQMVRDGLIREEDAFGHPDSNVIQRALGQERALEPELQEPVPLDPGDVVLVCSDGLHGAVPDAGLAAVIGQSRPAKEICRDLLAAALEAGSQDNITIGCIRAVPETRRRPTRVDP